MTASSIDWQHRLSGGLVGLLVGDALGVPYEFYPPEAIPAAECIEFIPPAGFRRAHVGLPPGTYKGDGAQALIVLDSLLQEGLHAVTWSGFDIDPQASAAINRLGIAPRILRPEGRAPKQKWLTDSGASALPLASWRRPIIDGAGSPPVAADTLDRRRRLT